MLVKKSERVSISALAALGLISGMSGVAFADDPATPAAPSVSAPAPADEEPEDGEEGRTGKDGCRNPVDCRPCRCHGWRRRRGTPSLLMITCLLPREMLFPGGNSAFWRDFLRPDCHLLRISCRICVG